MGINANYANTPRAAQGQVSTANTNRDGTGTLATILTAGSSGSRVDDVRIQAVGTTTAGMVRLFVHDGTNARLYGEVAVPAITPSGTTPAFSATLTNLALLLPNSWSLRASTHNAETFNVIVTRAGDF